MANKFPKTKWNWIVPSSGSITILPIYCPGEKKNRGERLATHLADGLLSAGFLPLIMGRSISIHGETLQESLVLLVQALYPWAGFETQKLQSFKVMQYHPPWWPGGAATFREHQLWWFNVYGALMLLHRALALGTLTGHFFNPCL